MSRYSSHRYKGNSLVYVNETPWRKEGIAVQGMTSAEVVAEAGLDYKVEKRNLYIRVPAEADITGPQFRNRELPSHFATVRTDNMKVLGVVGPKYVPIQNSAGFKFFDTAIGEGQAIYHTAGVLREGAVAWLLAKLPNGFRVGKDDMVDKYLLFTANHDGTATVKVKVTPIRVICQNTLNAALRGVGAQVSIRHTSSAADALKNAHTVLELSHAVYDELDVIFNTMYHKPFISADLREYVKALIPDNKEADSNERTINIREKIYELHEVGKGAELAHGTAWGAYNAVTEYIDHVQGSQDSSRALKSMWFGAGDVLKQKAFDLALKMSNN